MIRRVAFQTTLGLAFGFILMLGSVRIGEAIAADGSGAVAPLPPTLHNPTLAPVDFASDLRAAYHHGWSVLFLVVAFGLLELAAKFGEPDSGIAFLTKGRTHVLVAGATAIVVAAYNALAQGGAWTAAFTAALSAGLLFYRPGMPTKEAAS